METRALKEYKRKRRFHKTPEPEGKLHRVPAKGPLIFVVQKHAASRLHYDFRLEMGGVLKSWAIPKGPSRNPQDKRLAVHVEDHPFDYKDFEGIIPQGEYGGGTVLLWDQGTWIPEGDPEKSYQKGKLVFELKGKKLKGQWALFRMHGRAGDDGKNWLLVKHQDKAASDKALLTDRYPKSVVSGKTIEEVAKEATRVWRSRKKGGKKNFKKAPPSLPSHAREAPLPDFLTPQLATLSSRVPDGPQWLHEIKFDGYRAISRLKGGDVRIMTRKGLDWTSRFSSIARALHDLPGEQAILDGEIVKLKADGSSSFQELQNAIAKGEKEGISYYLFDILHWNGYDFTDSPLEERRRFLEEILKDLPRSDVRFSESIVGSGPKVFQEACRHALEGIVSKRRDLGYEHRRSRNWLKIKCIRRQEFVIAGYTEPTGSRRGFGALILGVYDGKGSLRYTGHVGTGFTHSSLLQLHSRLKKLEQPQPTLKLPRGLRMRKVHWVKPQLVAEVEFTEWTDDGVLRHPSFEGLREDKVAPEVVKERPRPPPSNPPSEEAKGERAMGKTDRRANQTKETEGSGDTFAGVRLTHPDKILFAKQGVTKRGLALYYLEVADFILPYLKDRPLSLVRCPEGAGTSGGAKRKCFYQKHLGPGVDTHPFKTIRIKEKEGTGVYIMANSAEALMTLVQMGVLEIHPWGSRADDIEHPDLMTFDLDPDPRVEWRTVIETARLLRTVLSELKLKSFVKTTGGKGLHVVVPISSRPTWDEMKEFSKKVVQAVVESDPTHYTADLSKAKRKGKIFLDYLRNQRGATAVAPYSTRARPEAPVAVPLFWDELNLRLKSDQFNVKNLKRRLAGLKKDPWEGIFSVKQSLTG